VYDYAHTVRRQLRGAGFHADVDVADRKMQKKVREAQLAQYNYILVVGEEERAARTVNVRTRDNHVHGQHSLDEVEAVMRRERDTRSLVGLFGGEAAPAAADGGGAAPAAAAAAEGQ
jgi:threonyl-tRNA synthetase